MGRRKTFAGKVVAAGFLVAVADITVFGRWIVPLPGLFALLWTVAILTMVRGSRRGAALVSAGGAVLLGAVLIDDPSLLGVVLCWVALSLAALLPSRRFDDAARWMLRLVLHGLRGTGVVFRDLAIVASIGRGTARPGLQSVIVRTAVPLVGSMLFLALFASANPLIGDAIARVEFPGVGTALLHGMLWAIVAMTVWPSLRPSRMVARFDGDLGAVPQLAEVPRGTVTLSLWCFNAVFALPNVLDLVFLWSRAALPEGVTLADYAHRGAYTLIGTALLAALFVLVALRPGSASARSPAVRRLLVLWIAQNVLLVASSVLRLIDYIAAYSLTELRIAALAWMGLVGVGLILVCWRLLRGRSAAWLVNTNVAAAATVLVAASVVDLGTTAAAWNVRQARNADDLDLCYLNGLGASALLPLIDLEKRVQGQALRERVAYVRNAALRDALDRQGHVMTASWRNARRMDAAMAALGPNPLQPRATGHGRACDGSVNAPPPLTRTTLPRTRALTAEGER